MSRKKKRNKSGTDGEDIGQETAKAEAGAPDAHRLEDATDPETPAIEAATTDAETELDRLRRESREMRDLAQRKQAEFENYRKRMERDRLEFARYAGFEIVKEVLPVLDNLDRAIRAGDSSSEEQFRAGIEIIHRQLQEILARMGLTEVESKGKPFDPHVHEAVSRIESEAEADGTVLEVYQKGYLFKDRLLRPAMVSVAKAASGGSEEPEDESEVIGRSD